MWKFEKSAAESVCPAGHGVAGVVGAVAWQVRWRQLGVIATTVVAALVGSVAEAQPVAPEVAASGSPSVAQPELDRFGRALVQTRCKRPQSVKRERVPSARSPSILDAVWTTVCPGFEVVVFRPAGGRDRPMSLTLSAPVAGWDTALSVGSRAAKVRERLGAPWETQGEDLVYALQHDRPNEDTLTFRIRSGQVVEVVWQWETD